MAANEERPDSACQDNGPVEAQLPPALNDDPEIASTGSPAKQYWRPPEQRAPGAPSASSAPVVGASPEPGTSEPLDRSAPSGGTRRGRRLLAGLIGVLVVGGAALGLGLSGAGRHEPRALLNSLSSQGCSRPGSTWLGQNGACFSVALPPGTHQIPSRTRAVCTYAYTSGRKAGAFTLSVTAVKGGRVRDGQLELGSLGFATSPSFDPGLPLHSVVFGRSVKGRTGMECSTVCAGWLWAFRPGQKADWFVFADGPASMRAHITDFLDSFRVKSQG